MVVAGVLNMASDAMSISETMSYWLDTVFTECALTPFPLRSSNHDYRESRIGWLEGNIWMSGFDNLNGNWLFQADLVHRVRYRPSLHIVTDLRNKQVIAT